MGYLRENCKDSPEEISKAFLKLDDLSDMYGIGIMSCRSGWAVDVWIHGDPERIAYSSRNNNSFVGMVEEAVEVISLKKNKNVGPNND